MDIYSRLLDDRIIFPGMPVDALLLLRAVDHLRNLSASALDRELGRASADEPEFSAGLSDLRDKLSAILGDASGIVYEIELPEEEGSPSFGAAPARTGRAIASLRRGGPGESGRRLSRRERRPVASSSSLGWTGGQTPSSFPSAERRALSS